MNERKKRDRDRDKDRKRGEVTLGIRERWKEGPRLASLILLEAMTY